MKNKVKLDDVIMALEMSNIDTQTYYNKKTNEILYCFNNNKEASTYTEDHEYNADVIFMFGYNSKDDYEIMRDFIYTIKNSDLRQNLFDSIEGRGAFRTFKDTIYDFGIEDSWYKYMDNRYRQIAIVWCNDNEIAYEK